jgi:flagellar hook assembly protein FlgD
MATTSATSGLDQLAQSQAAAQAAAGSKSTTAFSKLSENFDSFLKLLTAQLQNQDPSQPMDSTQFTQQLVQYAGVEQQIRTNTTLDGIASNVKPNTLTSALSFMGRQVEVKSNAISVEGGAAPAMQYELPTSADQVKIEIKDSKGAVVRTMTATASADKTAGRHDLTWDGTDNDGAAVADGSYTVSVTALDAVGTKLDAGVYQYATITEVKSEKGEAVLYAGKTKIKVEDVSNVYDGTSTSHADAGSDAMKTAISLIGKKVEAYQNGLQLTNGDKPEMNYALPSAAAAVTIKILDSNGKTVRTIEQKPESGTVTPNARHEIEWDGNNDAGQYVGDGYYYFNVSYKDESGKAGTGQTFLRGTVTQAEQGSGTAMIYFGQTATTVDRITNVFAT